jgi:hypothetical protein
MLKTNAIILTVVYLLNSGSSIKDAVGLARHSLAEMPQSIPLTALLYGLQLKCQLLVKKLIRPATGLSTYED